MDSKRITLAFAMLMLFLSISTSMEMARAWKADVKRHVMCTGIDKSQKRWEPTGATDTFSTSNKLAIAFFEMENVVPTFDIKLVWAAPDGTSSVGHSVKYEKEYLWAQVYATLDIEGTDRLVGIWKSEVRVGDTVISTVQFKIQPTAELVSKTTSPKEGEPVFPGDIVTAIYELKNAGKTTLKAVKFALGTPLPEGVTIMEATPAKDMTPGSIEKFVVKVKFGREGTYELKMQLVINEMLILEGPLVVRVSPVPFWQNPIMMGGIVGAVAVVTVVAISVTRRKRVPGPGAVVAKQPVPTIAAVTKYCINCGAAIPMDSKFCGKCGATQG